MARHFGLGDADRHFWITRSVARVMGVSLSDAMARGDFSAEEYRDLVTRCRMCGQAESCELWLGRQKIGTAANPPEDCVNGARIASLKQ